MTDFSEQKAALIKAIREDEDERLASLTSVEVWQWYPGLDEDQEVEEIIVQSVTGQEELPTV